MGGFNWTGRAWRLAIPPTSPLYGDCTANNFLEFLAMAVTIWLVLIDCDTLGLHHECILGLGDNTSALCWLFKSSHIQPNTKYHDAVLLVARKLALLITESSHCLASQHIPGNANTVSDLLSFQADDRVSEYNGKRHPLAPTPISNDELTERFHSFLPQLIPQAFDICQLPSEVASFVTLAMQTAESSWMRLGKPPLNKPAGSGDAGPVFATPNWALSTHASMMHPQQKQSLPCEPFSPATGIVDSTPTAVFVDGVQSRWYQRLSQVPQALWLRNSGTVASGLPFTSRTATGSFPP